MEDQFKADNHVNDLSVEVIFNEVISTEPVLSSCSCCCTSCCCSAVSHVVDTKE